MTTVDPAAPQEWAGPAGYVVSTDRARLDVATIHRWLSEDAYWSLGRPLDVVARSIEHSLSFGLYAPDGAIAGFCRMVTDWATFAWLCDVYVDPARRAGGVGTFLVRCAIEHPALAGLKRQVLATADAHGLYAKFGYVPFSEDDRARWMLRPGPGR